MIYENVRNYVYEKFASILTQDVIAFSNYSKLKDKEDYDILINNYIEQHKNCKNLENLLEKMCFNNINAANFDDNEKENAHYIHKIVVTFYPYYKSILKNDFKVENKFINLTFSKISIAEIFIFKNK